MRTLKACIALALALLPLAAFAQAYSPAGKTFYKVGGWEEMVVEYYAFSDDGTYFQYARETPESNALFELDYSFDAGMYGTEILFEVPEYADATPPFRGSEVVYVRFFDGGPKGSKLGFDLMVAYDSSEVIGLYATDPDVAFGRGTYAASSALSETLKGKKVEYSASNLADPDLAKFWAEAAKGPGSGEWIDVLVTDWDGDSPDACAPLVAIVFPGVPMDPDLFAKNGRPASLSVGTPGGRSQATALDDSFLPQLVAIPAQSAKTRIRFLIAAVYAGAKYQDLCIGKIFVLGKRK